MSNPRDDFLRDLEDEDYLSDDDIQSYGEILNKFDSVSEKELILELAHLHSAKIEMGLAEENKKQRQRAVRKTIVQVRKKPKYKTAADEFFFEAIKLDPSILKIFLENCSDAMTAEQIKTMIDDEQVSKIQSSYNSILLRMAEAECHLRMAAFSMVSMDKKFDKDDFLSFLNKLLETSEPFVKKLRGDVSEILASIKNLEESLNRKIEVLTINKARDLIINHWKSETISPDYMFSPGVAPPIYEVIRYEKFIMEGKTGNND